MGKFGLNDVNVVISVESYINNVLASYNKNGWCEKIPTIVYNCLDWYKGFVKDFHTYYVKTSPTKVVKREKMRLYMAKKACEDWANMLCNEKCDIVISEKEKLDDLLLKTHTWKKLNNGIELSFALGYGCIVQGVKNLLIDEEGNIVDKSNAEITNTFVPATMMRPLTFNEGELEDVAFVFDSTKSTNVIIHIKDNRKTIKIDDNTEVKNENFGFYDIVNIKLSNDSRFTVLEQFTTHLKSTKPCFQLIRPNNINNFDIDSPLGLSVYANSIPTLQAIDNSYDSLNNEIQLGRKRIVADIDQYTSVDDKGNEYDTFDPNDTLIYSIPARDTKMGESNKQLLEDISGDLRIDPIIYSLNEQLNVFSSKLGMGENYYNYEVGKRIQTATQVVSENTQLFRTLKKHEILLDEALKEMVLSFIFLNNNFTNNPPFKEIGLKDITIQFDDSIIEDTKASKDSDRQDVSSGLMSPVEYRMKYYGEDEKTATEKLLKFNVDFFTAKATSLYELLSNGTITPEVYVDLVYYGIEKYITNFDKEKFIEAINESLNNKTTMPSPFDLSFDEEE